MTAQYKHEHRHLIALAETILRVAVADCPDAAGQLTRARLQLSRDVHEHCGHEIKELNARGPQAAGTRAAALVRKYHDDLLAWRHDLVLCNSHWPPARVVSDASQFTAEFGAIADRLRERVRWEEEEFYPVFLHAQAA